MEFSVPLRCARVAISPDGSYVATTTGVKLSITSVGAQEEVAAFTCVDEPQVVEWSPDSLYLLTAVLSRSVVQLWSVADRDWRCRIDAGTSLVTASWAPSSRHVLTTNVVSLRVTVWSLVDRAVCYIKYAKDVPGALQFSLDGEYLAVLERRALSDHISLFGVRDWELVAHVDDATEAAAGLTWSPDSSLICIWEDWRRPGLAVFDLVGRRVARLELPATALGVRAARWCPSGQLLAAAGDDDQLWIVSDVTWRVLTTLRHGTPLRDPGTLVYRECESRLSGFRLDLALAAGADCVTDVSFELSDLRPVHVRPPKSAGASASAKRGVSTALFSPDNSFLASRWDAAPCYVWIWRMASLSLHSVLQHRAPVRDLAWQPGGRKLVVCTGSRHLYAWSVDQASTCRAPVDIAISQLLWSDRLNLLLIGKGSVLFCKLDDESEDVSQRGNNSVLDE